MVTSPVDVSLTHQPQFRQVVRERNFFLGVQGPISSISPLSRAYLNTSPSLNTTELFIELLIEQQWLGLLEQIIT